MMCLLCGALSITALAEETEEPTEWKYFADRDNCYYFLGEDVAFDGEYESVKAEYDVWMFVDEQNEEMSLVTEKGLKKEKIVFYFRGNERVGLPENAETIDWHFFVEGRWADEQLKKITDPEAFVRDGMEKLKNAKTAYLSSPYFLLGAWYDLNHDGIYQEIGIDYNGDLVGDFFAAGIGKYGDVNSDGSVNAKDLLSLRRVLAGMAVDAFSPLGADLDGDGEVTMKDLLLLRQMVLGTVSSEDLPNENRSTSAAEKRWNLG